MEFLSFILPGNEPMQWFFFLIILLTCIASIQSIKRNANANNWHKNWLGGDEDNTSSNLDSEHGSVTDISHAVATKSEQLAEIMPGMLLIIGLLGTFLGLGLALNKASAILTESASGLANIDGVMANLMAMMEGLGTKFKASTWGIIGFITLKAWHSWNGYEESRLRWCIEKVKQELDTRRIEEGQLKANVNENLIQAINGIGGQLSQEISKLGKSSQQGNDALSSLIQVGTDANSILKEVSDTSKSGSDSVGHVAATVLQLQNIVTELKSDSSDIKATVNNISTQAGASNILLEGINESSAVMSQSLSEFSESTNVNIGKMGNSAAKMADASSSVSTASESLILTIDGFKDSVAEVMGIMKNDLSQTISDMSESFGHSMGGISENLTQATGNISTAVDKLSVSVEATMDSVKGSISDSVSIQTKAHAQFATTSEVLSEQVVSMTGLIEDLRERILSGLKAVAESGKQVRSLNNRYESSSEMVEELINRMNEQASILEGKLQLMTTSIDHLGLDSRSVLDGVSSALSERDGDLSDNLEKLIGEFKSLITLSAGSRDIISQNIQGAENQISQFQKIGNDKLDELIKIVSEDALAQ